MSDLLPTEREQALEARLVELEMRVSFQEQALAELSDALADARMQGMRNADVLRVLLEDLGKVRNALNSSADFPYVPASSTCVKPNSFTLASVPGTSFLNWSRKL